MKSKGKKGKVGRLKNPDKAKKKGCVTKPKGKPAFSASRKSCKDVIHHCAKCNVMTPAEKIMLRDQFNNLDQVSKVAFILERLKALPTKRSRQRKETKSGKRRKRKTNFTYMLVPSTNEKNRVPKACFVSVLGHIEKLITKAKKEETKEKENDSIDQHSQMNMVNQNRMVNMTMAEGAGEIPTAQMPKTSMSLDNDQVQEVLGLNSAWEPKPAQSGSMGGGGLMGNSIQNTNAMNVSATGGTDVPMNQPGVTLEWHSQVKDQLRNYLFQKLFQKIFPIPDTIHISDRNMVKLLGFARKVEGIMYEQASSRKEYFYLLAEKIYKIQKELEKRHKESNNDEHSPCTVPHFNTMKTVSTHMDSCTGKKFQASSSSAMPRPEDSAGVDFSCSPPSAFSLTNADPDKSLGNDVVYVNERQNVAQPEKIVEFLEDSVRCHVRNYICDKLKADTTMDLDACNKYAFTIEESCFSPAKDLKRYFENVMEETLTRTMISVMVENL